jgi:glycosyltransferase involved in cell wall biosynthesis
MQQTLDSIVAQTHRPIEIITIDDASDDASYAFAKVYSQKNATNDLYFLNLQNTINAGAGISRNKALQAATGDYIAFLDADDLWKPHKLAVQLKAMKTHNATVCYGAYELFTTHPERPIAIQNVFKKLSYHKLRKANYLGNLTGLYHAAVLGKIAIPALRKRQDWAMWLDVLKKGGDAVGILEPVASYRIGNGLSSNKADLFKYNYAVYRKHLCYTTLKSVWCMALFFYEQFVVKRRLKVARN